MQIIIYGRYCLRYKYILWYIKFFLSIFMILIVFMYYFCNREKRNIITHKKRLIWISMYAILADGFTTPQ